MIKQAFKVLHQSSDGISLSKVLLTGTVQAHHKGFGFLSHDGENSIFLPPPVMRKVFHGDIIEVNVVTDDNGRTSGELEQIVEPGFTQMIGKVIIKDERFFIQPDHKKFPHLCSLPKRLLKGARGDDYVLFERVEKAGADRFKIEVVRNIGKVSDPGFEHRYALHAYGLLDIDLESNFHNKADPEEIPNGYRDLRHIPFVTIDGESSQDLDDAVYVEEIDNGWHAIIAIADVSAYVEENSKMDLDAVNMSQTIYMPGCIVPMLPSAISTRECSLVPGSSKQALIIDMKVSAQGDVESEIYFAVMESVAKLSYSEVNDCVEGWGTSHFIERYPEVYPSIKAMHSLFRLLESKDERDTNFDRTEFFIHVDYERKKVSNIKPSSSLTSHKIIEQMMLLTNRIAAKFIKDNGSTALFRIHGGIDPEYDEEVIAFLKALNIDVSLSELNTVKGFTDVVNQIKDKEFAGHFKSTLFSFLEKSRYSVNPDAHFGLGRDFYLTMTSPIRRYPDLVAHRAIRCILENKGKDQGERLSESFVEALNESIVRTIKVSNQADRLFKVQFTEDVLMFEPESLVLNAKIVSIGPYGVNVLTQEYGLHGFLYKDQFKSDTTKFEFNETLKLAKVGAIDFYIGKTLKVKICNVARLEQSIIMELVE